MCIFATLSPSYKIQYNVMADIYNQYRNNNNNTVLISKYNSIYNIITLNDLCLDGRNIPNCCLCSHVSCSCSVK